MISNDNLKHVLNDFDFVQVFKKKIWRGKWKGNNPNNAIGINTVYPFRAVDLRLHTNVDVKLQEGSKAYMVSMEVTINLHKYKCLCPWVHGYNIDFLLELILFTEQSQNFFTGNYQNCPHPEFRFKILFFIFEWQITKLSSILIICICVRKKA